MEHVEKFTGHCNDLHHEISLPLRDPNLHLPVNKSQTLQRANHLKQKFLKDPQFFEDYKAFVNDLIINNHAEKVEENKGKKGKIWYIQHHWVYHKTKHKLRVVFDCSAKYKSTCLNDHFLPGSDITNRLLSFLLFFRRENVAIQGDIKQIFLQVKIPSTDRD